MERTTKSNILKYLKDKNLLTFERKEARPKANKGMQSISLHIPKACPPHH